MSGGQLDPGHAVDAEEMPDVHQSEAIRKAVTLASTLLEMPERFGLEQGDDEIVRHSLDAMKGVFDFALESETEALVSLRSYFNPLLEDSQVNNNTRAASNGKKRKRNKEVKAHYAFLDPTPLDGFTVDSVNEDQLWHQLELKNEKMNSLLGVAMIESNDNKAAALEESDDEDEQKMPSDEVTRKKSNTSNGILSNNHTLEEEEEDEEDDLVTMTRKKVVHRLKDLSDDDLLSLGIDPARREEMEMMDEGDEEEDEDDDFLLEESEEEEEDDDMYGYAGASDLSDDDEMHGKIIIEPLRTEEEQRRRQAEMMAEEKQRAKRQRELKRLMGIEGEADDEEDDEQDEEGEGDGDEEDSDEYEESEESEEDDDEEEKLVDNGKSLASRMGTSHDDFMTDGPSNPIASLDAREFGDGTHFKKWKTHPILDDDFFSIDQFNKDTDDYGDEGIDLGEEVNLFMPLDVNVDEPLLYNDFFAPPPGASTKKSGNRNKKEIEKLAEMPKSKPSVRFHEEVAIRQIKGRKSGEMEITPELLEALRKEKEEISEGEEVEEEEEEDDDDFIVDDDETERTEDERQDTEQEVASNMSANEKEENQDEDEDEEISEVSSDVQMELDELDEASEEEAEIADRVAGDLFAEEEVEKVSTKIQSNHEKRLEKLQNEIAALEKENVAKKDWTLMGETGSRARPENSLLAESLDFENNQKSKPIITQETTVTLEELIKKRIMESNFDDVKRRAHIQAFDFVPSKMLELSDTKSGKSLDQIYEDEMGMGNGESNGEKMNKQLEIDHEEIRRLYDELENKLDSLSNAHFTPKAPKASIQTIANTPTITLEESLPSTSTYASQLAPEEIYDAGRHSTTLQGERSEMTPEEKKRLQRQLRSDKKARNEKIKSVKKTVEINKDAFAKNRGGRFVGASKRSNGSRNDAKEKEEALLKLMGNKGVSVVGKDGKSLNHGNNNNKKKRRIDGETYTLNASHLKL